MVASLPAAGQSVVALENRKPGTSEWKLSSTARVNEIEGYASLTSVARGESIELFVNTTESTYTIDIFRMGWYGGTGGRRMGATIERSGVSQLLPAPDPITGLIECNWRDPFVLSIPASPDPTEWASGFYLAKLTTGTSRKQSYIIFVVRDDSRPADYLFQASVTTWQAYNNWGGKSLYPHSSTNGNPARKVSFNRPYGLHAGLGTGQFLNNGGWEYNMVRWMEREGFDVKYGTNVDTHARAGMLAQNKAFLSVGHDEYWSHEMRSNVTAARDRGVNLAFFAANGCYWQIRLESSPATGAPHRTMVGYKEFVFTEDPVFLDTDPGNDHLVTTKWRRWPLLQPESSLIGVMFGYNPVNSDIIISNSAHWIFTGTGLRNGDRLVGLLGYEVDRISEGSPSNIELLARSPFTTADGLPEHADMTLYSAASGAMVFAAGTIQWSWGLDDYNAPESRPARESAAAKRITRNILNRFAGHSLTQHRPRAAKRP